MKRLTLSLVAFALGVSLLAASPWAATEAAGKPSDVHLSHDIDQYASSQLDYHMNFRAAFDFLSEDEAHITGLVQGEVEASKEALHELGLELTDSEWAEFLRRQELLAHVVPILRIVTGLPLDDLQEEHEGPAALVDTGDLFAGIWMDHQDGGVLKLAVTDASQVDLEPILKLLPRGSADIVIIEQPYARTELQRWREQLTQTSKMHGVEIATGWHTSDEGVRLRVIPRASDRDLGALMAQIPADAYVIDAPTAYVRAGHPASTHSFADQQSGLQVGIYNSGPYPNLACTWGVTGHTASYAYVITAGHCFTAEGTSIAGWGLSVGRQNATGNVISTTPSAFVYARHWDGSATLDHGRISSPYADTNCYHGEGSGSGAHCQWRITSRISLYAHSVGQTVCASLGVSNAYRCGNVTDADYQVPPFANRVEVSNFPSSLGDSGAGMKWRGNYHGLLTDRNESTSQVLFQPAYYVKAYMGSSEFDFNCVRSGSWWGACPISYSG